MAVRNGAPDASLGANYPFEDKYLTLADGTTMHYIEQGRAGLRRPTLLLLHGNPTWSFLYRRFMAPLSKVARVIAVDTVGYGRSDHPSDPAYHRLDRHISNLEEFVRRLGLKRVIPVVHDWGGPIGLGYATRQPNSLAGLVVLNTWAFTERAPLRLPWFFKALRSRGIGEFVYGRRNAFVEQFIPRLLQSPPAEGVMEGYRHPFPNRGSRTAMVAAARMIPDGPDHPDWSALDGIDKALPHLDVPTMILWGSNDPAFPKRFAWAFSEALPQAREPEFFADAGHWLQEDIPDALVARIREFVKSL